MNLDFSDDQKFLQEEAKKFLEKEQSVNRNRSVLENDENIDIDLWNKIVGLGWTGIRIPEEYDGLGLGHLELCVIAEELGRYLAPVPFSSSVYLFTEAIINYADDSIKKEILPKLVSGEIVGTLAVAEELKAPSAENINLTFSEGKINGTKIAVPIAGERPDIEILDINKGSSTKITTNGVNWWPIWSPDDTKIIFVRTTNIDKSHQIIQVNSAGTSPEKILFKDNTNFGPDDWSSDSSKVAIINFPKQTGYLDLSADPIEFKELTSSKGSSIFGFKFSPNGKWISFSSSIAGGYNCYIAPIDKPNEAYILSNIYQGEEPIWSPNGDEIFYRAPQGMYRVPLEFNQSGGVEIGKATMLFSLPWIDNPGIGHAMHPNGEKFLVVVHEKEEVADHFNIILNFNSLIKQKFLELKN